MKLEILILSIFLIASVMNITTYNMYSNSEKQVSNLYANNKYYFTISAYKNNKYTFRIKVKNTYYSSYFSLSYIGHVYSTPSTSNEEGGYLSLSTSSSLYYSGYNIYESSSYTVSKSSINYLTFVLTPSRDIDLASITILETNSLNDVVFIIVFFTIFIFCVFFCIIFWVCRAFCECFKNRPVIQTVPQNNNYTPLQPQYQQPQPQYQQPQPQYIPPPQYNQPNQYAQAPQYINPQQNINAYAPGQLYAN